MRRAVSRALACGAAALLLIGARCPAKQKAAVPARNTSITLPDSADQVVAGYRGILADRGVSRGELLADTAYSYADGTRIELVRVNVTFRTAQGQKEGALTSRYATYNVQLGRLEARGSVVLLAEDGRRLDTEQLVYDQRTNQIRSDSAFVANQPPRQISGIGFETDPKMTLFRSFRNTKIVTPLTIPAK